MLCVRRSCELGQRVCLFVVVSVRRSCELGHLSQGQSVLVTCQSQVEVRSRSVYVGHLSIKEVESMFITSTWSGPVSHL